MLSLIFFQQGTNDVKDDPVEGRISSKYKSGINSAGPSGISTKVTLDFPFISSS